MLRKIFVLEIVGVADPRAREIRAQGMNRRQNHVQLQSLHRPDECASADVNVLNGDPITEIRKRLENDLGRRGVLRRERVAGKEGLHRLLRPASDPTPGQLWPGIGNQQMKFGVARARRGQERLNHEPQEIDAAAPGDEVGCEQADLHLALSRFARYSSKVRIGVPRNVA